MSNAAKKILEELNEDEKKKVLSWAENARVITNDGTLNKKEKVKKLYEVTVKEEVVVTFLKSFLKAIKTHGWGRRGWAGRLTLSGLALGLGTVGIQMTGVASAGFGIGIPIFLLTAAGGALLGTIIDELKR